MDKTKIASKCNNHKTPGRQTNSLPYQVDCKIIWKKNRSFRNRENLKYKKTTDSVLLSLFMRTNEKCNNSHAPSTGLRVIRKDTKQCTTKNEKKKTEPHNGSNNKQRICNKHNRHLRMDSCLSHLGGGGGLAKLAWRLPNYCNVSAQRNNLI